MLISVVVPCYNDEAVIDATHARLCEALAKLADLSCEILYVDDGSGDRTIELLYRLEPIGDIELKILRLSRNFGHQIAVTAGLDHARGDAVVVIDSDLQDPPEVILEMVDRWREGYHVVYGARLNRAGETGFKLITAKVFYRLMNRLSETKIPLDVGDFRLMDRRVVDVLKAMPEKDRFLRAMVTWVGFRQTAVFYKRLPRLAGESSYSLWRMIRFAVDGVISFSFTPLRVMILTGFCAIAIAFAGIIWAVLDRLLTNNWVRGWTSLFVAILFMGGVQLISLGIIGEYVGRIFGEVKNRPLYLIQDSVEIKPTLNSFAPAPDIEHPTEVMTAVVRADAAASGSEER